MELLIKGLILGCIIVLPGMSGGTILLIFGLYEKMVNDLTNLIIKPYIPLLAGSIIGIFLGGIGFTQIFEKYPDLTLAFLLGCLLASVRPVLRDTPKISKNGVVAFVSGALIGYIMVGEPIGLTEGNIEPNWFVLLIGGALASAAMILPGIPGSSVLIILGIYDVILSSIAELNISVLVTFGIGSLVGITSLLKLISMLYERHKSFASYLFAGLILGSTRGVIPSVLDPVIIFITVIGFTMVWIWSGKDAPVVTNNK